MKNAFFNLLSFMVIMCIIGVVAVFALIYLDPYSAVNPFPPPTLPAALSFPTLTPTFFRLPATWTPEIAGQQAVGVTLKPSSTPLTTQGSWRLFTNTPPPQPTATATVTETPTPTLTPTVTSTGSGGSQGAASATLTATPNYTMTALSQNATNAAATSQAKTATALAGGPAGTQTVQAMPTNPTSATETHGVASDSWQNTVSDPAFRWNAVSGAAGYYVYWGTDPNGSSSSFVTGNTYDPPAVTTGTYYLRLRTIFAWGAERPNWTTVFIFRYDNSQPPAPGSATETNGVVSGVWQNSINAPQFTWSAVSDVGSGVARYEVYLGVNPNGTTILASPTTPAYNENPLSSGNYYLRVRTVDVASNYSSWATIFNFRYDGTPPGTPGNLTTSDPPTDATPSFTWSASSDAHSGVSAYELYFGTGPACGSKNQPDTSATSFTAGELTAPGEYRLCVRARDNAGNLSAWAETTFTYAP